MIRTFIQFVISFILAIIIAAFYALFTIDLNDYKQEIETAVLDATGRQLTLQGEVSISWSPIPTLLIEKAQFANAGWASSPHMVTLDQFEVSLALYPLLERQIQVSSVLLKQPVITIETNAEGKGNWLFDQMQQAETDDVVDEEAAPPVVIVNELDIEQATIHYIDGVTGEHQLLAIDTLSIDIDNLNDPLSILFEAIYDDMPLQLEGQIGGMSALMANTPSMIDLNATAGGIDLSLKGDIALPHAAKGLDLNISIRSNDDALASLLSTELPQFGDVVLTGHIASEVDSEAIELDLATIIDGLSLLVNGQIQQPQLASGIGLNIDLKTDSSTLSTLAGSELPPVGDIQLTGLLTGGDKDFAIEALNLNAGQSDLAGMVTVSLTAEKPVIEADLASKLIDLTGLDGQQTEQHEQVEEQETIDKADRLFSDDPIVLKSMRQLDAKLNYKADMIKTAGLEMQDMNLAVDLTQGHLKVKPIHFGFAGSELTAQFNLNAQNELAVLDTRAQINGFKLSKIAALSDTIAGGNTDVYLQAKASGTSVSELMAGLNGKAIAKVAESQIADGSLDILGADFVAELGDILNPFSKEEQGTQLTCAVVNFNIKDGIATADKGIAIQTDKLNIIGDGSINLKNEQIDISIKPEPRTGIGVNISQLASLVRVGGTLANPGAEVDAAAVLSTGVSGAAAVATGGLSVVAQGLIDRTTADQNPCDTALGIKPAKAEPAEPKTQPAAEQ